MPYLFARLVLLPQYYLSNNVVYITLGYPMGIHVRSKHLPMILSLRSAELPPGVSVEVPPVMERRDISEAWATAIFQVVGSVPAAIIAALLVKLLIDKRSTVITINRKEVELEEGEIVRVVEESTRIEQ